MSCTVKNITIITLLSSSLFSCSKPIEIEKKNGIHVLKNVEASIDSVDDIDWKVGKQHEEVVSSGVKVEVSMNQLPGDIQAILIQNYEIDSFLFKLQRRHRGHSKTLGYVLAPFISTGRRTGWSFTTYVYYSAAAVSDYFRNLSCPAYEHRWKIEKTRLISHGQGTTTLFASNPEHFKVRSAHLLDLPISIDGEKSLLGEYWFELALYSEKKSRVYGRFLPINKAFEITKEKHVDVLSCTGVKPENDPVPTQPYNKIQDLQINN